MKKSIALVVILLATALFVFADSQQGRTEGNLSDSSFVIQGYYKGTGNSTTNSITLTLTDYNNKDLSYSAQNTEGASVVNVSNSHLGSNTGTIFTWSMTDSKSTSKVTLRFTFSPLQALVNGIYYRPSYSFCMTINPTVRKSNKNKTIEDTFDDKEAQFVTGSKASQNAEFIDPTTVEYSGRTSSSTYTWYRSGTCTLNISDYEQGIPGSYEYRCWIVTELTST